MDALRVNALGPAALAALKAVPPAPPATQAPAGSGARDLATGLAQDLFQRAFQASAIFPVAEPQTSGGTLVLGTTASLLAALNAPQAPAEVRASESTGTAAPAAVAATPPDTTTSTAAEAVAALGTESPGVPDATSLDFALETALRFGAGVGALGAPLLQTPNLDAGLVRDATAVLRQGSLQPHAGGPGPEAFARPQALAQLTAQRALQSYQPPPTAGPSGQLDLLA